MAHAKVLERPYLANGDLQETARAWLQTHMAYSPPAAQWAQLWNSDIKQKVRA